MKHEDMKNLLEQAAHDAGVSLASSSDAVARYAVERAAFLTALIGEPGYELAVAAERDNVALYAGLALSQQASAADQRLIGVIQGALSFGARVI